MLELELTHGLFNRSYLVAVLEPYDCMHLCAHVNCSAVTNSAEDFDKSCWIKHQHGHVSNPHCAPFCWRQFSDPQFSCMYEKFNNLWYLKSCGILSLSEMGSWELVQYDRHIRPKHTLNSNLAKSRWLTIIYCSVVKSFWKFALSTAVPLPCSVQNFKTTRQMKTMPGRTTFREIWVYDAFRSDIVCGTGP